MRANAVLPQEGLIDLAERLNVDLDEDGFLLAAEEQAGLVATTRPGIFAAGCASGPKDIPDTVAQASAAASKASIPLSKGEVTAEPTIAYVNEDLCCGCKICESVCAYSAIEVEEKDEKEKSKVNEALCVGCGSCAAACPSRAITMRGFTTDQIMSQIEALTKEA